MPTYYVDPAASGLNNGGSWDNAWTSIQSAYDTAVDGDIVYCRGTQIVSSTTIDIDTNGGTNARGFIKFIGCNSSGVVDGTRFKVDGQGTSTVHLVTFGTAGVMIWHENFEFKRAGSSKNGVYRAGGLNGSVFINCAFPNNGGNGINSPSATNILFYRCTAYGNAGTGFYCDGHKYLFCSAHDNTVHGFSYCAILIGCLSFDNGDDNYGAVSQNCLMLSCVSNAAADDGIALGSSTSAFAAVFIGCRVTNQSGTGDIGLNCNSEPVMTAHCYFENNNGDNIQNAGLHLNIALQDGSSSNIEDQANTNQGYVSLTDGSEDFNLRSDASLRRQAITIPVS